MNKTIALVDCNSFYCSCERLFKPKLRDKPVVVLSNNDGCVVSLTKEAKKLGIQMGDPFFKIQNSNLLNIFSSNYPLYADISQRVMKVLEEFSDTIEVYSIDEAFVDLTKIRTDNLYKLALKIKKNILKNTGIPVSIGIAKTKVLSKIANKIAKTSSGIMDLTDFSDNFLSTIPIESVWGIGNKSALKLKAFNIITAKDFIYWKNENLIRKLLSKVGLHIQNELRGISCIKLEESKNKKNISCSRSFGQDILTLSNLKEAIAAFVTTAAEKLRNQKSVANSIMIYISTNRFRKDTPQYKNKHVINFLTGTSDTLKLINYSNQALIEIFKPGFEYKKAGIILMGIVPETHNQSSFIDTHNKTNHIKAVDIINKKYGLNTIKSAACGTYNNWKSISNYRSKRYTTCWDEIMEVY